MNELNEITIPKLYVLLELIIDELPEEDGPLADPHYHSIWTSKKKLNELLDDIKYGPPYE